VAFGGTAGEAGLWPKVVSDMRRLSHASTKRMSKALTKKQHATFRRLHKAAGALLGAGGGAAAAERAEGGGPDRADGCALSFPGGSVECTTWRQMAALHGLRECARGGLGRHLGGNPTAAGLMGDSLDRDGGYGGDDGADDDEFDGDTRGKTSAKGRAMTARRGKERANRQQQKDSFFADD